MRLDAAATTHVGQVRDGNEDSFVLDERLRLFAVADGMGGHRGGEVASATAIEALRAAVAAGRALPEAVELANVAVLEAAERSPDLAGMGTTLTALIPVGEETLLIGHVGDSRAYLLRAGGLERLTEDHSLVEELVREGRLTPEQADVHPQRNIVTRALGVEPDITVDVYSVTVRDGDRVVICSDGLTTMVRERDVLRMSRPPSDPQETADRLVEAANDAGGEDNITVVVIDVAEVEPAAEPDPAALAEPSLPPTPAPTTAPDDTSTPAPAEAAPPTPALSRRRRVVGRLLLFVPLLLILVAAFGVVGWYARSVYYVGLDDGEVVLWRGRPGGLLFWEPEVADRTGVLADELTPADRADIEQGTGEGSRDRAERYLEALLDRTTTTTSTTTTSTTTTSTTTTTSGPPRTSSATTAPARPTTSG